MLKKVDILKDDKKELLLEIEENERLGKQVELHVSTFECLEEMEPIISLHPVLGFNPYLPGNA